MVINFLPILLEQDPFILKKWKHNEKLILLKNNHYFEFEKDFRLPYLDGVSVSFIKQKGISFYEFYVR